MFAPTIFKEHKFVDGGIIDNLPAQEVRKLGADKVLSIRFSSKSDVDPKNVIEVVFQSRDSLNIWKSVERFIMEKKKPDYFK